MTSLADLTAGIRTAVGADSGLGHSLKYDFEGDGFIFIEGGTVSNEDAPADLTLTISLADFLAMGTGELDPMKAAVTGKLKFSNMMKAMSLQPKIKALMDRVPKP